MKKIITKVIMVLVAIMAMVLNMGCAVIQQEESKEAPAVHLGKYVECYLYNEEYNTYIYDQGFTEEEFDLVIDTLESYDYMSGDGLKIYFVLVDTGFGHEEMYAWLEGQPSPYDLYA